MTYPITNLLNLLCTTSYTSLTNLLPSHLRTSTKQIISITFQICTTAAPIDEETQVTKTCYDIPLTWAIISILISLLLFLALLNLVFSSRKYISRVLIWMYRVLGVQRSVFNPYRAETPIYTSAAAFYGGMKPSHMEMTKLDPIDVSRTTVYGRRAHATARSKAREPGYLTGFVPEY